MPVFAQIGKGPIRAIATYLAMGKKTMAKGTWNEAEMGPWLKYMCDGYNRFLDPDGYPANKPPWGTLNAINMNTGKFVWKIPFGLYPNLVSKGLANTGCMNFGGPVVTAGGRSWWCGRISPRTRWTRRTRWTGRGGADAVGR